MYVSLDFHPAVVQTYENTKCQTVGGARQKVQPLPKYRLHPRVTANVCQQFPGIWDENNLI